MGTPPQAAGRPTGAPPLPRSRPSRPRAARPPRPSPAPDTARGSSARTPRSWPGTPRGPAGTPWSSPRRRGRGRRRTGRRRGCRAHGSARPRCRPARGGRSPGRVRPGRSRRRGRPRRRPVRTARWRAAPRRSRSGCGSRPYSRDLHHAAHPAEAPHDAVQLIEVLDHELEGVLRLPVADALHLGVGDVDAGGADGLRHGGQESRPVDAGDLDLDWSRRPLPVRPLHVDAALGIALQPLRASERVHRHPPPAGDEARDALARQRAAALPEADQHVLAARPLPAALRLSADEAEEALQAPLALLAPPLELLGRQDAREHALRGDLSVPDAGEQRLLIALGELARDAFERAVLAEPGGIEMVAGEIPVEDLPPDGDRPRALLRLDVGTDASLGARALDELQPVLRRRLAGRRDDLDGVTALQLVAQRHDLAVHARAGAVVPDLGVDAVGEVDDRGADREVEQVALRREDEHLVGEQVLLDGAEELLRVLELLLPFEELAEPGEPLAVVDGAVLPLVAPVGRDAVLCDAVHLARADLDLDPLAVRADDRGVQRLIAVGFRQGDVVLEAPRHRLPVGVRAAERLVAFAERVDDDAEGDEVVDLVVQQGLRLH